ncbi:MAG: hypothetical protein O7A09_03800 [Proteobacteria bacterium]|nr:hypothetical protein [Pseudomonadota bacterium]
MGRASLVLAAIAVAALAPACASFKPQPLEEIGFRDRVETASRNGLTVSVAVLSRDEARRAFGVDLYGKQIQPVWLRIENQTQRPYRFLRHGIDPQYFSAHEAAYKSHFSWRPRTNRRMDNHFDRLGVIPTVPALGSTEGFAFTNAKLGIKGVRIRLLTERSVEDFQFYLSVPGFRDTRRFPPSTISAWRRRRSRTT